MPSLFEADASDLQRALGRFANGQAFGRLARTFFTRFVHGLLDHYLSRELAGHQGLDQRFGNDRQRAEFEAALQQHCWEASLIVEAYAGGWLGKHVYKEGLLTERHIADFAAYSLTKIRQELRSRADG